MKFREVWSFTLIGSVAILGVVVLAQCAMEKLG
jgi:hypothetical protein